MKAQLRTEYLFAGGTVTLLCALGSGVLMPFLPGIFPLLVQREFDIAV